MREGDGGCRFPSAAPCSEPPGHPREGGRQPASTEGPATRGRNLCLLQRVEQTDRGCRHGVDGLPSAASQPSHGERLLQAPSHPAHQRPGPEVKPGNPKPRLFLPCRAASQSLSRSCVWRRPVAEDVQKQGGTRDQHRVGLDKPPPRSLPAQRGKLLCSLWGPAPPRPPCPSSCHSEGRAAGEATPASPVRSTGSHPDAAGQDAGRPQRRATPPPTPPVSRFPFPPSSSHSNPQQHLWA